MTTRAKITTETAGVLYAYASDDIIKSAQRRGPTMALVHLWEACQGIWPHGAPDIMAKDWASVARWTA